MSIPIGNAIYDNNFDIKTLNLKKNSFDKKNQTLTFEEVDKKKFPTPCFKIDPFYRDVF